MDNRSEKTSVPISSLEKEVEAEANSRSLEVLVRLLDKVNNISTLSPEELLKIYVALKIKRHHLKRDFMRGHLPITFTWENYQDKVENLKDKILIARRNYYVAKQCRFGTSD